MVFLDVVYNHFGPEGNYLGRIRAAVLLASAQTPWGSAIDYARAGGARASRSRTRCIGCAITASTACGSMPCTPSPSRASRICCTELSQAVGDFAAAQRPAHPSGAGERRQPASLLDPLRSAARRLSRAMERRLSPRLACAADRRDAPAITATIANAGAAYRAHAGARASPIRASRRRIATASRAASRARSLPRHRLRQFPAEPRPDRQPAARRAAGSAGAARRRSRRRSPCCCCARCRRCCSWARNGARREPFPFFCDFKGELADAVRKGRRREFAEAYAAHGDDIPDPLAAADARGRRARLARARRARDGATAGLDARAARGAPASHRAAAAGHDNAGPASPFDRGVLHARWRAGARELMLLGQPVRRAPGHCPPPRGASRSGAARRRATCRRGRSMRRSEARDAARRSARHLPPAADQGLRLRRRRGARALSQGARHHASLHLAVPQGAARQHARLRHRRSRPAQSRARRRGRLRAAERRAASSRSRPHPRFRAEPHGGRPRRQCLVARRAGMGPEIAARGVLRHRLGGAAAIGGTPACCCRFSASPMARRCRPARSS